MKYLLDTNVCIRYLNGQSDGIRRRLDGLSTGQVALCSIVRTELLYGALKSARPEKNCDLISSIVISSFMAYLLRKPAHSPREQLYTNHRKSQAVVIGNRAYPNGANARPDLC
jgi:predicted nucleic acid-binding protein